MVIDVLTVDISQNDTTICESDSLELDVSINGITQSRNDVANLTIGDTYQGGIVFYLDGNGGGLVAAPADQAYTDWGCPGAPITGADGILIGTGMQNTIAVSYTHLRAHET